MHIKVPAESLSVLFKRGGELTRIAHHYDEAGHPAGEILSEVCQTLERCRASVHPGPAL